MNEDFDFPQLQALIFSDGFANLMGEGSFVKSYDNGRVVLVAKRVEIGDNSAHQLRIAVDAVEDVPLLHHVRIDQRCFDDMHRPCLIAFGVESSRVLDVVYEADNLYVFVVGLDLVI